MLQGVLIGVSEFARADEPCGTLLACLDELRSLTCAFPPSIGGCLGTASQQQCSGLQIEKEIYRKKSKTAKLTGLFSCLRKDLNGEALLHNINTQILVVKNMYQKNCPTEAISDELLSTRERT